MFVGLLPILFACKEPQKGFGVPVAEADDPVQEPSDSAYVEPEDDRQVSDVLSILSTYPDPPTGQIIDEWVDVATYDEFFAVQVGVSGVALVSRQDGRVLDKQNPGRGYSVDSDGDLIIVGSRTDRISLWRYTEPSNLSPAGFINEPGVHEKVAVYGEVIAIARREQGVGIYSSSTDLQEITTIPASDAYAVDICGDWLWYSDAQDLVWVNIQDPITPQVLLRNSIGSEIRDIECDGQHVALGLGGNGVKVFRIEESELIDIGTDQPPGTVFSVSLDGTELWVATWTSVALYSIEQELLPLGHEDPLSSAMGVAARDGTAVVADWLQSTIMERTPNAIGSELHLPQEMTFRNGDSVSQYLWVHNHGGRPLELSFNELPNGFSVTTENDSQAIRVPVGEYRTFEVRVPDGNWSPATLGWQSNDPDEIAGTMDIRPANNGVGSLHADFALPVLSSSGLQGTARLVDFTGKVLFLSWWSDY